MLYIVFILVVAATAIPSVFLQAQIRINEVSPANASLVDEDNDASDWIELYNAGAEPVHLKGYRIGDKNDYAKAWHLPDTTVVAGGYLLIRASGKNKVGSGLLCVEGVGAGINPWNTWDAFHYVYQPVEGDFEIVLRVHSLRNTGTFAKVGLLLVDKPEHENRHAGIFATTRDVFTFSLRETTLQPPVRVTDLGLPIELPDTWVRLRRTADSVYAYASLLGDAWEPVDSAVCPLSGGAGYLGIAVASYQDTVPTYAMLSNLTLNGEALPFGQLTSADIETHRPGSQWESFELHANFELKNEGEAVYLWNETGNLVDSLVFGSLRTDMTCGRAEGHWEHLYFTEGTPCNPNGPDGRLRIAAEPRFSIPGGRYDSAVELSLTAEQENDRIFYTTDGSEPDTFSAEYTDTPIVLVSTATIRARIFATDALPGAIQTATYLVRETTSLPIVALAAAPDYLWGSEGIFDHPLLDIEVPVHVEMWENDGAQVMALDAGVKVHGRITRTLPQKSLRLYARSRYGTKEFDYPVFPSKPIKAYDRLLLRNSGQDWYSTFIRDALYSSLVSELRFDVQAYRPVNVFLNGQYWGLHNLRERIDEKFVEQNRGVDEANIDMLEEDAFPRTGSSLAYRTMTAALAAMDMTDSLAYVYIDSAIDLGSFADYNIAEIFASAGDWPQYNQKFWRERTEGGRWKWIMSDIDMGLGLNADTTAYQRNTLEIATSPTQDVIINPPYSTFLLRTLLKNPRFRDDFINRTADILNTTLHADRIERFADSLAAGIESEVPRHVQRWDTSLSNWQAELEKLKYFSVRRQEAVRSHYVKKFGLSGTARVTLNVAQPGSGMLRFSTVLPDALPWSGVYFKDVPITATAVAAPGYRFVRWDTPGVADSSTVTIVLEGDMELTAVFAPEEEPEDHGVVINEIMYKPSDERDSKDWIELYNGSGKSVDLSGWVLKDEDDEHVFVIPSGTVVGSEGYVVLCNSEKEFTEVYGSLPVLLVGDVAFGFGTPSDAVRLYDTSGKLADSVRYDSKSPWPVDASGTGRSIELLHPGLDNSLGINWRSSVAGGTPGEKNGTGTAVYYTGGIVPLTLMCFPNPVRTGSDMFVRCTTTEPCQISFSVVDIAGIRVVDIASSESYASGEHLLSLSTGALVPGVYFLRATLSAYGRDIVRVLPFVVQ